MFAGSPDDNNAHFFFDGAMSVLKPYIDSGKLKVLSGQTSFEQGATLRWDGATAQSRFNVLVIASIDGEALTDVLEKANKQDIKVISYDRLLMNSKHVDYYATFDNHKVGELQGKYIEEKLGLRNQASGGGDKGYVGISMPTKSSERWVYDGKYMVKEFEKLGYKTDLQYAEDVVENQVSQIENMITKGHCNVSASKKSDFYKNS
ncbi:hypothetical protein DT075_33925 [Bacillus licheniformis]|nr:hypothetical protein DT075_33925 [Bacillus licheniformis]